MNYDNNHPFWKTDSSDASNRYAPMNDSMAEYVRRLFNKINESGYVLVKADESYTPKVKPKYVIVKETMASGDESFLVCLSDDKNETVAIVDSIEAAREKIEELNKSVVVKREVVE